MTTGYEGPRCAECGRSITKPGLCRSCIAAPGCRLDPAATAYLTMRRIDLLAKRPRLLYAERAERARQAVKSPDRLAPLDVLLLAGVDDADVVAPTACG